ncbi:MAG: glycosyltransferase [Halobacteriovorax sp.]|nr:glycosyltransferase [Halobacteriovorax sp.]
MGMEYIKINTMVGQLTLVASARGLAAVLWEDEKESRVKIDLGSMNPKNKHLSKTKLQLQEFFAGERSEFDLDLDPVGTEFQMNVWNKLQQIPYGQTASYKDLAIMIGNAKASRAIGMANGKNPLSIVVPCHRVIGASGELTGYAGGLENKKKLLQLEQSFT